MAEVILGETSCANLTHSMWVSKGLPLPGFRHLWVLVSRLENWIEHYREKGEVWDVVWLHLRVAKEKKELSTLAFVTAVVIAEQSKAPAKRKNKDASGSAANIAAGRPPTWVCWLWKDNLCWYFYSHATPCFILNQELMMRYTQECATWWV